MFFIFGKFKYLIDKMSFLWYNFVFFYGVTNFLLAGCLNSLIKEN